MTERRSDSDAPIAEPPPVPRAPRRPPIRKPGPFAVIAGSVALFLAVTALLAFQMRAGADPALGATEPQLIAATTAPRATPAPRKVLIRRVIVTKVVEHHRRAATASAPPASAPAPSAPSAPIARVAPAPAAPAPARAPLTTRSS